MKFECMFDVITIGSAVRDVFMSCSQIRATEGKEFPAGKGAVFPMGSKIDVDEMKFMVGGGAVNTAVTFANQKLKAGVLTSIGKDTAGDQIRKFLKERKISADFIYEDPERPTSYSTVISLGGGDRTIFRYKGAKDRLIQYHIPWNSLKTKWFYVNHLEDDSAKLLPQIIDFAKKKGIKIAFNPGSTQIDMKDEVMPLLKHVDVFMVNQEEASALTGISYERKEEIFKKLDEWVDGIVIMTKGPEGVDVSDGKTLWSAGVLPLNDVVDRTGAGDAFGSGFIAALIQKPADIEYAIQFASANATGVLTEWGATNGLLKKNEPIEKFGKLNIKKLAL